MSKNTLEVTDATFAEVLAGADKPVLVDFWATWCKPCLMVAPVLEEIATEHADSVVVAKLDVDANGDTARQFDVRSIPTMILFRDGQPVERIVGAQSKANILASLGL